MMILRRLVIVLLCGFVFSAQAETVFKNGVISSSSGLSTSPPAARDDLIIALEDIKDDHLDVTLDRAAAIRFEQRVGIGAPQHRWQRYIGMTRRAAIALVVEELAAYQDGYTWPGWITEMPPLGFMEEGIRNNRLTCSSSIFEYSLAVQWSRQLLNSPVPQFERQAMFWLDHFSVAYEMYNRSHAFAQHLRIIRQNSNGNYIDFLKASLEDPGVIFYLNNDVSYKDDPNENLAREFLELFALGEGAYSEAEIRNLAKMLAGNGVNMVTEQFYDQPAKRVSSPQTAFGQTYRSIDEFMDILIAHPEFGAYIARKFFEEYVALDDPTSEELAILVSRFRQSDFDIPAMLAATLSLPRFWDDNNRLTLVKSPVDLVYGTARTLGSARTNTTHQQLLLNIRKLNQNLFNPPNIAGWPTGRQWIGGQNIEKRIKMLREEFKGLATAEPLKLTANPSKSIERRRQYLSNLDEFFASAEPQQLAVETVIINWIPRDFGARKYNDVNLSFYNLRFMGQHYDGITIEFGHDRNGKNKYGNYARVKQTHSSPDVFSSYKKGWRDDRDGAMVVKFSYPSGPKTKRWRGRSTREKLLIKRLAQSFKLLLDARGRHPMIIRSEGGQDWMQSIVNEIGFDPITTSAGDVPPVKIFVSGGDHWSNDDKFSCGGERAGIYLRQDSKITAEGFRFNDTLAELSTIGASLDDLLLPDVNLGVSNENYVDLLTFEGFQLK
ncbi:MAG: DUF1800 family protein [Alphaproteobacteria bacterium]|nr:DUF1800 family protein [Alphaproteobacteria bacterium]